ncbi:TetR/AcrR family transcriptional regulator [Pseudomonas sp. B392_1p]|uniref:TetR/AcrR family transcriptional regulator n=1 Tax=Pseudomonas sp. B392_1p TaxID=3457507 RepID=UPI003FD2ED65
MSKVKRGARADGEATRARILEAAGELFACAGFAETTSKAIATRAGADLASINYHFGGRDGLYQAVLVEAHRRLVDVATLQRIAQGSPSARDRLRRLIEHLVQSISDDAGDWRLTVLAAEILAPSSHIQVLFQSEVPQKLSLVLAMFEEITGIPAQDPALLRCLLSVAAPCLVLLIGRRGLPGPLQEIRQMPQEAIVEHLHEFAMAGLQAIGRKTVQAQSE